jgi:hypothetical protein
VLGDAFKPGGVGVWSFVTLERLDDADGGDLVVEVSSSGAPKSLVRS